MSRSLDRKRIAQKYDAIRGDDAADAALTTNAISELVKAGGAIASQKMASDAAKKAADKAAADAKMASGPADLAKKAAMDARQKAVYAAADAMAADAKAAADPSNKSLQDAAKAAHLKAANLDADAKAAEAKASYFSVLASGGQPSAEQIAAMKAASEKHQGFSVPVWVWAAGGVVGVGLLGLLIYKLAKRS